MLTFLCNHWFDIAPVLAAGCTVLLALGWNTGSPVHNMLLINLTGLFIHQFEEYRFPGRFPRMLNSVMFKSREPDRFPLNTLSALLVNVGFGWAVYFAAFLLGDTFIIAGIIIIIASFGNIIAHTLIFNIRGRTFYNPGMITCLVIFFPLSVFFCQYVISNNLASWGEWIAGAGIGLIVSVLGIFGTIKLFEKTGSKHVFHQ